MIGEIYTWMNSVTNHAILLWVVFMLVTGIWFSTMWAVKQWIDLYRKNLK